MLLCFGWKRAIIQALLEGRLQRQLILREQGVRIKNPTDFFEENMGLNY